MTTTPSKKSCKLSREQKRNGQEHSLQFACSLADQNKREIMGKSKIKSLTLQPTKQSINMAMIAQVTYSHHSITAIDRFIHEADTDNVLRNEI
uniref:Uncharacterized protein n=1 Tax=Pristionchus pacificus TaxID=54126 RepID=A0A2A6CIT3_PRIPA|eukprot:PDM77963.1 hypothetical protein PRIPAC_34830 [Pristionchus pacificus]